MRGAGGGATTAPTVIAFPVVAAGQAACAPLAGVAAGTARRKMPCGS